MQKLKITYRTAEIGKDEKGAPKIVYNETTSNHIVASTKSQNNLLEELKGQNKIPASVEVKDLFIDRDSMINVIDVHILSEIEDAATARMVADHIIKGLDGISIFKPNKKK